MHVLFAESIVFLVNVPFGYRRVNEKKFSVRWFAAVHAPVPPAAAVRLFSGLGWQLVAFPLMITAFFCGRFAGGFIDSVIVCENPGPRMSLPVSFRTY